MSFQDGVHRLYGKAPLASRWFHLFCGILFVELAYAGVGLIVYLAVTH